MRLKHMVQMSCEDDVSLPDEADLRALDSTQKLLLRRLLRGWVIGKCNYVELIDSTIPDAKAVD